MLSRVKCTLSQDESLPIRVTRKMVGLQHVFGKALGCACVVNYESSQQEYIASVLFVSGFQINLQSCQCVCLLMGQMELGQRICVPASSAKATEL